MKIGELSGATATKVTTIRFYEEIGLLDRPVRTASVDELMRFATSNGLISSATAAGWASR